MTFAIATFRFVAISLSHSLSLCRRRVASILGPRVHRVGALPQQWGTKTDRIALIPDGQSGTFHQLENGVVSVVLRKMLLTAIPSKCPVPLLLFYIIPLVRRWA